MSEAFRKEYQEVRNESLLAVNAYYFSHREELAASFRKGLEEACRQVRQMQAKGYPDVEYMEVTMLRTRLLQHDYRIPILVYGTEWYADPLQRQAGEVDGSGIFSFYESMIQKAAGLVKKYRMQLPEHMLEGCMCQAAEFYWNYAQMACQRAVMGFTPEGINMTDQFRIRVCEYMGYGMVCRRYTPVMEPEKMKKWFDQKEEEVYRFRDYRGCDFTGWDFGGLDLTGCDFSGCIMDGCNFEGADLTGAWFHGCSMKRASLRDAWMPGASFDGANLEGAVLEGAYSDCRISYDLWLRPDNEWASFTGCCLRGTDFTCSDIECADFTGADMEGAVFQEDHREYYEMEPGQKEQVQFIES